MRAFVAPCHHLALPSGCLASHRAMLQQSVIFNFHFKCGSFLIRALKRCNNIVYSLLWLGMKLRDREQHATQHTTRNASNTPVLYICSIHLDIQLQRIVMPFVAHKCIRYNYISSPPLTRSSFLIKLRISIWEFHTPLALGMPCSPLAQRNVPMEHVKLH